MNAEIYFEVSSMMTNLGDKLQARAMLFLYKYHINAGLPV